MTIATPPAPAGSAFHAELDTLVLEQLMRSTDDEIVVLTVAAASTSRTALLSAVGRALIDHRDLLQDGSPLRCLIDGGVVDPQWRSLITDVGTSLWSELQLLETLHPHDPQLPDSPLDRLLALRLADCDRHDTVS